MVHDDVVFNTGEAAQYMKISLKSLYPLLRERWIVAARIGSDWRILRSAIDRFLEGGKMINLGIVHASNGEKFDRVFFVDRAEAVAIAIPTVAGAGAVVESSRLKAKNPAEADRLLDEWLQKYEYDQADKTKKRPR